MSKRRGAIILTLLGAGACAMQTAPPRPQVVLVIDTNVPIVGQLAGRHDLSLAAAIDTVRVDVLASDGSIADSRELVVPDPSDWPLSIGFTPPPEGVAHVRVRGFRSVYAHAGSLPGHSTLEPTAEVTIDRLVALEFPTEGVRTLSVRLEGDCIGVPASFARSFTTCVDGAKRAGDPADGVDRNPARAQRPTEAGTWPTAGYMPCTAPQPAAETVCIPGGFGILGDLSIRGVEAPGTVNHDSVPLRTVTISPFFLDRYEVTVGRLRKLGSAGLDGIEHPAMPDGTPGLKSCQWKGFTSDANDAFALNCVTWRTALQICRRLGGSLPTEAQWEYAARGRGEQRTYPWGATNPPCCASSIARQGSCGKLGIEKVGSHVDPATCDGITDTSRDGVIDLGGSLTELLLDIFAPYDAPCWGGVGIVTNPTCQGSADSANHMLRGSNWSATAVVSAAALRNSTGLGTGEDPGYGFRCAYAGTAP